VAIEQSSAWGVVVNAGCDYTGILDAPNHCAIGGGPGPSVNSYLQGKIAELHAAGKHVYGYVWTGGVPLTAPTAYRSTNDIMNDVWYWYQYSVATGGGPGALVDGIFLDGADRRSTTVDGVAQAESIAFYVAQTTTFREGNLQGWGQSIFNWGNIPHDTSSGNYLMPYLDCTLELIAEPGQEGPEVWNRYVVREDFTNQFSGQFPDFLQGRYYPDHFVAIAHNFDENNNDMHALINIAADWNAGNIFVTERGAPYYDAMPNDNVWSTEEYETSMGFYYAFGADLWDQTYETQANGQCPAWDPENPPTPSYP